MSTETKPQGIGAHLRIRITHGKEVLSGVLEAVQVTEDRKVKVLSPDDLWFGAEVYRTSYEVVK